MRRIIIAIVAICMLSIIIGRTISGGTLNHFLGRHDPTKEKYC